MTTGTQQTTSVACSSTTNSTNGELNLNTVTDLIGNFSAMSFSVSYSNGTSSFNLTESYNVQNHTNSNGITIYGVDLDIGFNGSNYVISTLVASNNTILSLSFNGTQLPTQEYSFFVGLMVGFTFDLIGAGPFSYLVTEGDLSVINTTSVTLGPTTVSVTNYQPSTLPYTYSDCGSSITMSKFEVQAGQVSGTTYGTIITYLSFQGTTNGQTESIVIKIDSITAAM
jgi:hypothetical protein